MGERPGTEEAFWGLWRRDCGQAPQRVTHNLLRDWQTFKIGRNAKLWYHKCHMFYVFASEWLAGWLPDSIKTGYCAHAH